MPDLLSTLIPFTPAEATEIPAFVGRMAHAWFMDRVTAHDRGLAERLHAPNEERPFTVSNLFGGGRAADGRLQLSPERTCYLRLSSYDPALTAFLLEKLLPGLPSRTALAGASFRLGKPLAKADDCENERLRPWVGQSTFAELVQAHTLQAWMPARVTLRFASPTLFKSQGHFLPLPLPRLVFEGLARRWDAFASVQIHPDVDRYADEAMAISFYRLHTELVRFGEGGSRGSVAGFLGRCGYALRVKDRYWMGLIHLLAAFALYAGVGKQTTMGLGQCRALLPRS